MKSSFTFDRAASAALLVPAFAVAGVLSGAAMPHHAHAEQSMIGATALEEAPDGDETSQPAPEDMLTWSIAPVQTDGADTDTEDDEESTERVSFRYELEPGESVEDEVVVTNFSEQQLVFDLVASDGIVTEEGVFDLLPDPSESTDAGTWIEIEEEVTIPAGDTATVPFSLTVPDDALPGDHPAGIAASLAADAQGNDVSLAAQVGARIHLRVAGDIVPTIAIDDLNAHYTPSWNPFAPGVLSLDWTVENTGNVRLGSEQALSVAGLFGLSAGVAEQVVGAQREILPGQRASNAVEVEAWPLGPLTSSLTATQNVVGDDEIEVQLTSASSETTVWAIPWLYLGALLLLIAGIVIVLVRRRRRKRAMAGALAAARAEGARAAAAERSEKARGAAESTGEHAAVSPDEVRETIS